MEEKSVFKRLLASHRCVALLQGFYEWAKASPALSNIKAQSTLECVHAWQLEATRVCSSDSCPNDGS